MSSVRFSFPTWPPVIQENVLYQEIIVWVYCALFILILPLIMTYYYYCLYKLRFVMAFRRRHFKLLTFLFIIILIDFTLIEPIHFLCGIYLSHLDLLYWIYFILSTFSTHIIVYTLLLKIWLLFYDIKWTKICIINDNQWRYHINNPLHQPPQPIAKPPQNKNKNPARKNGKNKPEEKVEHFDNNTPKSDMSWFVHHRQSFGNIQYIYKYFAFIMLLSLIISLASKYLFTEKINQIITNALILIPIVLIYILYFNTPAFNDIFSLRKETKYLLMYAVFCVITIAVENALLILFANQNNLTYFIELQLALILIYHMLVFGIFMFLVCYPIFSMIWLYADRMYGSLDEDEHRTHSILINEDRVSYYCCVCFISLKFINKIALFDAKINGINHSISAKQSMNLQMVASGSNKPVHVTNINEQNEEIEMTQKHKKQNKIKYDVAGTHDDDDDSIHYYDEKEEEDEEDDDDDDEYIGGTMTLSMSEDKSITFIAIKPAVENENENETDVVMDITIVDDNFDNKFGLLCSDGGLALFLHHFAAEFCLENMFAIIEFSQYQMYCKKQEKYIVCQRELRKKSAKKRYKKKKESIRRVKAHFNEEIKHKKEKIKLNNINMKRYSLKKTRKHRIKQDTLQQDMISNDDLILDEIASKPPINTQVSHVLTNSSENYSFTDENDENELDDDGNEGDDEFEEEDDLLFNNCSLITHNNEHVLQRIQVFNNLPDSTIINKPFIVNSKNKRIQQLELICIQLAEKYIFSTSQFQLNLPKHIVKDIQDKINKMKQKHTDFENNIRQKHLQQVSNEYNSSEDSDMASMPKNKLQLTYSESNYSNWYPQHYENELHVFFDQVIEVILNLIDDSFYRLQQTKQYKQFVDQRTKLMTND